jgi:ABC-2 type transport system permease protein
VSFTLRLLILRNFLDSYAGKWAVPAEVLGAVMSLLVYKFTSDAFGEAVAPGFGIFGGDYFSYVVIGELAVAIPIMGFAALTRAVQQSISEGTFDHFQLSKRGPVVAFGFSALTMLPKELFRSLVLILVAILLFRLPLSLWAFVSLTVMQLLLLPLFLALGFVIAGLTLLFGRGAGLLTHLCAFLTIMAGVYFPVSVLPSWLQTATRSLSPFTFTVETGRQIFAGIHVWPASIIWIALTGILFCLMSGVFFEWILKRIARRGDPLLLRL